MKGSFSNQIARLEHNMPGAGSNLFVVPTQAEIAVFTAIWQQLEAETPTGAVNLAAQHGYELLRYADKGDGMAESFLLREKKPIRRGWGLYARRIGAATNIIVEAPHPLFDVGTPTVALDVYRALHAKALFIAGAQRNANQNGSADVAHNRQTIFQAVHQAAVASSPSLALQIHGFATKNHPGYPQIVIGDGNNTAKTVSQLANALVAAGFNVGTCDTGQWRKLCGTQNIQRSTMSSGEFIHIELAESVRQNDRAFVVALAKVFDENSGGN